MALSSADAAALAEAAEAVAEALVPPLLLPPPPLLLPPAAEDRAACTIAALAATAGFLLAAVETANEMPLLLEGLAGLAVVVTAPGGARTCLPALLLEQLPRGVQEPRFAAVATAGFPLAPKGLAVDDEPRADRADLLPPRADVLPAVDACGTAPSDGMAGGGIYI